MSISVGQVQGNPKEAAELIAVLEAENERLRAVVIVAERICKKLEHPTASVTIIDQTDLRTALDALQQTEETK